MKQPPENKFRRWLKGFMQKRMPYMISCREFEDFVMGYLDGELPARQRSLFELHIRLCRECRQYLQAYKITVELSQKLSATEAEDLPDDVPEELVKAILKARDQ